MNDEQKIGYYAIIPATVLFNENLRPNAKLLYAVITILANKEGYCFASNNYLAKLFKVDTHTISNWLGILENNNYVRREYIKGENGELIQRRIYPNDTPRVNKRIEPYTSKNTYPPVSNDTYPPVSKNTYPYVSNDTYPMYQKVQYNNTSNNIINNNMIDSLFNYIMKREKKIPEDFKRVELERIVQTMENYEMYYPNEILERMPEESVNKIKELTYVIALIVKNGLECLTYRVSREELIQIYNECKARKQEYEGTDKEIENFIIYLYTSIKNNLVRKDKSSSFFTSKNEEEEEEEI